MAHPQPIQIDIIEKCPKLVRIYNKGINYLRELQKSRQEATVVHEFERLCPGWSVAGAVRVCRHRVNVLLEEQQHTIHDPHNQVRRLGQFTH